jgi:tRNA/tmRNA/rRNA uracil-C5-methylase (TrmA/RlmC/RlmD family)
VTGLLTFPAGIANVRYVASKAEDFLPSYVSTLPAGTPIVGIVDPPRNGLRECPLLRA